MTSPSWGGSAIHVICRTEENIRLVRVGETMRGIFYGSKMQPRAISCQELKCSDIVANARGGKQSALTPPLKVLLQNVTTPWQVSAYDNSSDRKSFDLRTTPEIQEFCKRLDSKIKNVAKELGCKEEKY